MWRDRSGLDRNHGHDVGPGPCSNCATCETAVEFRRAQAPLTGGAGRGGGGMQAMVKEEDDEVSG